MSTAQARPVRSGPVRSGTARSSTVPFRTAGTRHPAPAHPAGTGRLRRFLACAGRAVRAANAARVPF